MTKKLIKKLNKFGFDPDHVDDNIENIENNISPRDNNINIFYTKRPIEYTLNYSTLNSHTKSSEIEISKDFYGVTIYDNQIQELLEYRQNWKRVNNPFDYSSVNFSFVGSDVAVVPSIGIFQLDEVNDAGDITSYEVIMRDMYSKNKTKFIEMYEKKMSELSNIKTGKELLKKFNGTAVLNRFILDRSQFANRIAQITSIVGDKTKLYNLIRSYGKLNNVNLADKIVPKTIQINVTSLINELKGVYSNNWEGYINQKLKELLLSILGIADGDNNGDNNGDNGMYVVKPTGGSRGTGMRFAKMSDIISNLWEWMQEPHRQNGNKPYNEWMISRFVMSFLWKLNNNNPDSLKLCDYPSGNSPFETNIKTGLWNDSPVLALIANRPGVINKQMAKYTNGVYRNIPFYKQDNPSLRIGRNGTETPDSTTFTDFRNHSFNDTYGRINKARLWFVMELANGKYKIHVYNKVSFELCSLEFDQSNDEHFTDKQRLWTNANQYYYGTKENAPEWAYCKYLLDPVNASRASELDCNYIVNWKDGEYQEGSKKRSFPVNWTNVKNNLSNILKIFSEATKDGIHAISEAKGLNNPDFESKGAFQYFGMDFIVDATANVWLLEINTRPWSGHGNWWFKNFDTLGSHIPPKWLFLEGMIRKFVDPHFSKPERLPYSDEFGDEFETITSVDYIKLENPVVAMRQVISSKDNSNWIVNRQLHKIFKARGWGTFPFAHLLRNPSLVYQGMTDYIRYLSEQDISRTVFNDKVTKMYPYLAKAAIVNKIFPLMTILGNKAKLTQVLKKEYPIVRTESCPISTCVQWNQIIPYTIDFSTTSTKNWQKLIPDDIGEIIAKPALGKQGTGIIISNSYTDIIKHINSRPQDNSWVVSKYISNPLILKHRKSHIRTFFLVYSDKITLKVYTMDTSLIFFAALPYYKDDTDKFLETFLVPGAKLSYDTISKYKDITNLSKGNEFFQMYVKPASEIPANDYPKGSIESKLRNDTQRKTKDFGYAVLSGNAKKIFDDHSIPFEPIQNQINDIASQVVYSVRDDLRCINPGSCYQYIALDFMVDSTSKVWLLEVNANPGLKSPTAQIEPGGLTRFMNGIMDITLNDHPMIREINDKEYYIPKVMRSKSSTDLLSNIRKLTRKYPNLFNELLDIPHQSSNPQSSNPQSSNPQSSNPSQIKDEIQLDNTQTGINKNTLNKMTELLLVNQFFSGANSNKIKKMFGTPSKFLSELYTWQLLTGKNPTLFLEDQLRLRTKMKYPYLFMFENFKNNVNCNGTEGDKCIEVYPGMFIPQTHLVLGIAGLGGYNELGIFNLPAINVKAIRLVKKMKTFDPLLGMFCKMYNNKAMLKTIAIYFGIQQTKSKDLCDYVLASLIIYKSLGLIDIELPFANETFGHAIDLENNPVAVHLMSSLFKDKDWLPWTISVKKNGKQEIVTIDT
jgi:hypothetical protein